MVYLLKMVIFRGYVSHNQRVVYLSFVMRIFHENVNVCRMIHRWDFQQKAMKSTMNPIAFCWLANSIPMKWLLIIPNTPGKLT